MSKKIKRTGIWGCKIGVAEDLPDGSDLPMREAVAEAFRKITGCEPKFLFSGWSTELTDGERDVVENTWDADPVHAIHVAGDTGVKA